jgi:hypothetical protein
MLPVIESRPVRRAARNGWTSRLAKWLAAVAMAGALVSCGHGDGGTSVERSASTPPALESAIATAMQGSQLDVWGGGEPAPGGTTTMFVHRGHRAAEVYWTTDGWCVSRLFTWSVEHAVSATRFDVRYVANRKFADCVVASDDELVLEVFDESQTSGQRVMFGAYPSTDGTWTTRTTCSIRESAPAPCGFPAAAAAAAPWI